MNYLCYVASSGTAILYMECWKLEHSNGDSEPIAVIHRRVRECEREGERERERGEEEG